MGEKQSWDSLCPPDPRPQCTQVEAQVSCGAGPNVARQQMVQTTRLVAWNVQALPVPGLLDELETYFRL